MTSSPINVSCSFGLFNIIMKFVCMHFMKWHPSIQAQARQQYVHVLIFCSMSLSRFLCVHSSLVLNIPGNVLAVSYTQTSLFYIRINTYIIWCHKDQSVTLSIQVGIGTTKFVL